jgi:hypothetical protein
MTASLLAGLLFTYAGAPFLIFLALARFLRAQHIGCWWLAGLCAGLGPAVISRVLTVVYYAFPGKADAFYVAVTLVPFVLLGAYGATTTRVLQPMLAQARSALTPHALLALGGAICTALGLGLAVASSRGQGVLISAYAAYASQWSSTGPWWRELLTRWGAFVLAVAVGATLLLAYAGKRLGAEHPPPAVRRRLVMTAVLGGSCLFLLGAIFLLTLGRPVHENDAVQYFKVATLMYERSTLAIYPAIPAVPGDGMWAVSSHPLGYYGMLMWSFLIHGSAAPDPAKLVAPIHLVFCVVAMGVLMAKWGWVAFLAAALLLISTPAMFLQTVGLGIDPPRLYLLVAAAAWLYAALRLDDSRVFLVAGVVGGLCMNSHSVNGIVTPLMLAAVILCCYEAPWKKRLAMLGLTGFVTLVVGGERYLLNILQFGVPVYDDHVLWHLVPSLDFLGWRSSLVPVGDAWSRLKGGPLMGFNYWYYWGVSFWAALFGAILLWRRLWSDAPVRIALLSTGVTMMMLAVYFGFVPSSAGYAWNYRYLLTAFPFVAIVGGAWLGALLDPATTRS